MPTLFFGDTNERRQKSALCECGHLPGGCCCDATESVEKLGEGNDGYGACGRECTVGKEAAAFFRKIVDFIYGWSVTESFMKTRKPFGERADVRTLRRHRELPRVECWRQVVREVQQFTVRRTAGRHLH